MRLVKPVTSVVAGIVVVVVLLVISLFLALPGVGGKSLAANISETSFAQADDALYGRQPLISGPVAFVENAGQWPDDARFQVWGGSHGAIWLASDALWITVLEPAGDSLHPEPDEMGNWPERTPEYRQGAHIRLRFVDANPAVAIEPSGALSTTVSYFLGADEAGWRAQVPVWSAVRYVDLYPGVDLALGIGGEGWSWQLTTDAIAAGQSIRLAVEGADSVALQDDSLVLSVLGQQFSLPLPTAGVAYQVEAEQVIVITPSVVGEGGSGHTPEANPGRAPDGLLFSTFLGGVFEDIGRASAIDYAGRIVVAGWTESANFPVTPGAFDVTHNGNIDAYAARLRANGAALDYATFFGGNSVDGSQSVAVDNLGRVYLAGWSESSNFPTTAGAFDRTFNGLSDAFVLRLNEAGTALNYSTYLGGTEWDKSVAVAVDGSYRAYVAGYLFSVDYPTTAGAYDRTHNGNRDGFLTRMNATGSGLDYSTYLGGLSAEWITAVAVDSADRAYVTGYTQSPSFPTTVGAYDTTHNGGTDGFVTRFSNSGNMLEYSTFFGGSAFDAGFAIAVDSNNRAHVTGETQSTNFPTTVGAFDRTFNGQIDAFALRLNANGSSLDYSTYLGGSDIERGNGIAADGAGQTYVVGETRSAGFPTSNNAYDRSHNGGNDVFMTAFSPSGGSLSYSTFIGGSSHDLGFGVHVFDYNTVAIVGDTLSGNFPVTAGAYDTSFNGFTDVFAIKLEFVETSTPTFTWTPTPTRTPTPTWTPTPTRTWTPTPTFTWTPTPTRTPGGGTNRSQFLPIFARAVVATPTPTLTPVPGDPYEPNDSFSQAWGPLTSGQIYRALIYGPTDREDFYWFDMPQARSIQVDLWDIPAGNDYHLYLYNASFTQVGYSGNAGNAPENIQTVSLPAGRYYVRVQRVMGYSATEQYSLRAVFR